MRNNNKNLFISFGLDFTNYPKEYEKFINSEKISNHWFASCVKILEDYYDNLLKITYGKTIIESYEREEKIVQEYYHKKLKWFNYL